MACDRGLTLRPWLLNLLERNEIPNLIYDPDDNSLIRIPWNRQGESSEAEDKLFLLWAERHGDKVDPESGKTTRRNNFRNTLNKSHDFEERPELHELNKQSNNYRVYRLRTVEESRAEVKRARENKQRKLKRKSAESDCSTNSQASSAATTAESPNMMTQDTTKGRVEFQCLNDVMEWDDIEHLLAGQNHYENSFEIHQNHDQDQAPIQDSYPVQQNNVDTSITDNNKPILYQMLLLLGLSAIYEYLSLYTIELYYDKELVGVQEVNLKTETRFHHENCQKQLQKLADNGYTPETAPKHFLMAEMEFPAYSGLDNKILIILKHMGQGLTLRSDDNGNLFCTRACMTQIFHFDQETPTLGHVKLQRGKETKLFSYETLMLQLLNHGEPILETKRLFFGNEPHSIASSGTVSMTIIPKFVAQIKTGMQGCDTSKKSSMVLLSNPDSVDRIVESLEHLQMKST